MAPRSGPVLPTNRPTLPEPYLDSFRAALSCQSSPCSYGTFAVSPKDLVLFYGKDGPNDVARRLDMTNVNDADLATLVETCDLATFGRDEKDMYDETYRKAVKLDRGQFAIGFDPEHSGLMDILRDMLLEGHGKDASVRCELYKLNVYGGELSFRQQFEELVFDAAKAVSECTSHSIAFTFFSDVEHEVGVVKSGYRVTITWNLYLTKELRKDKISVSIPLQSRLREADEIVHWVNEVEPNQLVKTPYIAYGNQAMMGVSYGKLILLVRCPSAEERATSMDTVVESENNIRAEVIAVTAEGPSSSTKVASA